MFHDFCIERVFFANQASATAWARWPLGQVSALCTGVDYVSLGVLQVSRSFMQDV